MKTIRERAAEYTARRSPVTLLEDRLMQESFLAGESSIMLELKTVMSVSEDEHLRANIEKMIKYLEGKDDGREFKEL